MINNKQQVVSQLNKILPTYYELFVGNYPLPCITYLVNNNEERIHTKDAGVSNIRYTVKL